MDEFITLKVKLGKNEWFALRDNAQQDYREPAAQARYILQQALLGNSKTADANCEVYQAEQLRSGFAEVVQ